MDDIFHRRPERKIVIRPKKKYCIKENDARFAEKLKRSLPSVTSSILISAVPSANDVKHEKDRKKGVSLSSTLKSMVLHRKYLGVWKRKWRKRLEARQRKQSFLACLPNLRECIVGLKGLVEFAA